MPNLPVTAINTFENEVINIHTTTAVRLLALDPNAFQLYMFYIVTAKRQSLTHKKNVNPIKATGKYCQAGLHWGEDRFHRAKALLVQGGFVEDYIHKNEQGTIQGHYVFLHFLQTSYDDQNPSYKPVPSKHNTGQSPRNPALGNKGTNTVDEKRNTVDEKNIYTSENMIAYSKIANEHILSSPPAKSYSNKDPLARLTEIDQEQLAIRLNVDPQVIKETHESVWESIEAGDKYGVKNVKMTVISWVKGALRRHEVEELPDIGREVLSKVSPTRDIELMKRLAEIEKEEQQHG